MSKSKLPLKANPTFDFTVAIPLPGGDTADVKLTFKHLTKSGLATLFQSKAGKTDLQIIQEIVLDWDLDEECNEENLAILMNNYNAFPVTVFETYVRELTRSA